MERKFIYFVIVVFFFMMFCTACAFHEEGDTGVVRVTEEDAAGENGNETDDGSTEEAETGDEPTEDTETGAGSTEAAQVNDDELCCVYICGAVEKEGVYNVPPDSRVNDVLIMAGGYSEDAATGYVNLAEKVQDGERIYIPHEDEVTVSISEGVSENTAEDLSESLVNINTAGRDELMTLPGIGSSKADDIIKYREMNGAFGSIEELMNVNGIKEGTFNKLKDRITI